MHGAQGSELTASTDKQFLDTLRLWLQANREILILIRYSRSAGAKSFEFFESFSVLAERIRQLPAHTSIIAFRQRQLPLRGVVDDEFVSRCVTGIRNGSEFLLVELPGDATYGGWSHEAGESHVELREVLELCRGKTVAVGQYPPWLDEGADVLSAVVPDECGSVVLGSY